MLGVERDLNGWKAHALELWVESRERVADDLCVRADCFARLGFVEQAERDRYVAGRLRHRAAIDRVEAAELWRYHSLIFVHRREVTVGFMRTNAAQIASVEASAKPTKGVDEQAEAPEGSGWHMAVWSEDSWASELDLFPSQWMPKPPDVEPAEVD